MTRASFYISLWPKKFAFPPFICIFAAKYGKSTDFYGFKMATASA